MPSASGAVGTTDLIEAYNNLLLALQQLTESTKTLHIAVVALRADFLAHDHGAGEKYAGGTVRFTKTANKVSGQLPSAGPGDPPDPVKLSPIALPVS